MRHERADRNRTRVGTVTFGQSRSPALQAGEYTITVEHVVANDDAAAQDPHAQAHIHHSFSATSGCAVTGARFALTPSAIHSVFPPDGSHGEYTDVLAHIVLGNATLPWQRTTGHAGSPRGWPCSCSIRATASVQRAPHAGQRPRPLGHETGGARRHGCKARRAGPLPAGRGQLPGPDARGVGESWSDACRVIDVPVEVFYVGDRSGGRRSPSG